MRKDPVSAQTPIRCRLQDVIVSLRTSGSGSRRSAAASCGSERGASTATCLSPELLVRELRDHGWADVGGVCGGLDRNFNMPLIKGIK